MSTWAPKVLLFRSDGDDAPLELLLFHDLADDLVVAAAQAAATTEDARGERGGFSVAPQR